jgi:hypothetical protein
VPSTSSVGSGLSRGRVGMAAFLEWVLLQLITDTHRMPSLVGLPTEGADRVCQRMGAYLVG